MTASANQLAQLNAHILTPRRLAKKAVGGDSRKRRELVARTGCRGKKPKISVRFLVIGAHKPALIGTKVCRAPCRRTDRPIDGINDIGIDAPAETRRGPASWSNARTAKILDIDCQTSFHLVEEEDDAEQKQDVVVARHHVFRTEDT